MRLIWLFLAIDLLAVIALLSGWGWMAFAGWLMLSKGIYSLIFSFSGKNWFDIFGYADVFIGIAILASLAIPYLWLAPLVKAVLSMI